jgi:ankyrin repeat protein
MWRSPKNFLALPLACEAAHTTARLSSRNTSSQEPNGALPMMIQLLDAGAPTDVFGPEGASAVVAAVLSGHANVLDVLISGGIDVNRAMDNGATPISLAAQLGQAETISILAARGRTLGCRDWMVQHRSWSRSRRGKRRPSKPFYP